MNVKIMNMSIKRTRTHRLGTITHTTDTVTYKNEHEANDDTEE